MELHSIEAKSGLSRARYPESFLVSLYRALAPYRGCAHGCLYCDGRAEKYYVDGDFTRDIQIRENLPDLVARDVDGGTASREYGAVCIGSGVTDVYQGAERERGITRATLEHLSRAGIPIVILTKNNLILRDFDILSRFPAALVITTITTVNEKDARFLEPGASPPSGRLEIVRKAKEHGFFAGIMAMPLCPGISDGESSFAALLDAAQDAGADFVYPGGLTLRPGRQKDAFMALVDSRYPDLRPLYNDLYRENRQSGMPLASASAVLHARLDRMVRTRGMSQMIPHRVYRSLLSAPDSLFVLFCHMQNLYQMRGVDTRPLKAATDRYAEWLGEARTALRRKRGAGSFPGTFPVTGELTERLLELSATGNLSLILRNDRLTALASEILNGGVYFDYPSLSIVSG
ncbi:MAG TPA: radical SAM protein [Treponemataceae bacterium]|nr:radical SAM protein [Treponemataceae bacterium]